MYQRTASSAPDPRSQPGERRKNYSNSKKEEKTTIFEWYGKIMAQKILSCYILFCSVLSRSTGHRLFLGQAVVGMREGGVRRVAVRPERGWKKVDPKCATEIDMGVMSGVPGTAISKVTARLVFPLACFFFSISRHFYLISRYRG